MAERQSEGRTLGIWFYRLGVPFLAVFTAMLIGAIVIWASGANPVAAYGGLLDGSLLKQRALGETLVATTPYIFLALGVGFGFRCGLFNIGVEGQYYIGQIVAVWVGYSLTGLPLVIHLPLAMIAGTLAGALWASIPGFLKVRFGAHEVITTIMTNYIAIYLADYLVGLKGPMRDPRASVPQTRPILGSARLPRFSEMPALMTDPFLHVLASVTVGAVAFFLFRLFFSYARGGRWRGTSNRLLILASAIVSIISYFILGNLTLLGGPFTDPASRLHVGILMGVVVAIFMWWLLFKTTVGFEVRTVGANRNAAEYAGINVTRNFVLAMGISGALAGMAGSVELLGLERTLKSFFSAGYGFDSIAIALLGRNDPLATLPAALLFGGLRNGADLMELRSGVSKQVIAIVQALILMFIAAPAIIRWLYRMRAPKEEKDVIFTTGWGK